MASDARDRIIAGAGSLFARVGVRAAGVNAIIAESGVAKATFYRHFNSKDEVVAAWVESQIDPLVDDLLLSVDALAPTPEDRFGAYFQRVMDNLAEPDFAGYVFVSAAMDLPHGPGPLRTLLEAYLEQDRRILRQLSTDAGAEHPDEIAEALQMLILGLVVRIRTEPQARVEAVQRARETGERLIAASLAHI